ncbi:hypothetical protein [Archangium gephyra]|nr:hypothetical protein [Archangium gephyra]
MEDRLHRMVREGGVSEGEQRGGEGHGSGGAKGMRRGGSLQ